MDYWKAFALFTSCRAAIEAAAAQHNTVARHILDDVATLKTLAHSRKREGLDAARAQFVTHMQQWELVTP